jgi:hypothetical protein
MVQLYPAKAFYKVITEDSIVQEIDYIRAEEDGNLYLEKHHKDGTIEKYKLIEEKV